MKLNHAVKYEFIKKVHIMQAAKGECDISLDVVEPMMCSEALFFFAVNKLTKLPSCTYQQCTCYKNRKKSMCGIKWDEVRKKIHIKLKIFYYGS